MTTNIRTDIHSPKNLVTEDYTYEGAIDTDPLTTGVVNPAWEKDYAYYLDLVRTSPLAERGLTQCHHCGARLRYAAILRHVPTGNHITVGETCLDNRFARATADFHEMRKIAAEGRKAAARRAEVSNFVASLPAELAFLGDRAADVTEMLCGDSWAIGVVTDIRAKLHRYGSLSDRQVAFVGRLVAEAPGKAAKQAERNAEVKVEAPTGQIAFTGTVVKLVEKIDHYSGGTVLKGTVKVSDDIRGGVWLVYLTMPKAIRREVRTGDVVTMTANLTRSGDSPSFAFGKRPTEASIEAPAESGGSALD